MKTYISLVTFKEKALQDIKSSPQRAEEFTKMAESMGISVEGLYWTIGAYDGVIIFKAKDDAAMAASMLTLNSIGYVKTETLRAFDSSEFGDVLAKMN